jgi:hypothetical protein
VQGLEPAWLAEPIGECFPKSFFLPYSVGTRSTSINLSSELLADWKQGLLPWQQVQRRLFGLVGMGSETRQQIDYKTGGTAMSGVQNLGDVPELVIDSFDQGVLARKQFVAEDREPIGNSYGGLFNFARRPPLFWWQLGLN